jgi:hypothetical protein
MNSVLLALVTIFFAVMLSNIPAVAHTAADAVILV